MSKHFFISVNFRSFSITFSISVPKIFLPKLIKLTPKEIFIFPLSLFLTLWFYSIDRLKHKFCGNVNAITSLKEQQEDFLFVASHKNVLKATSIRIKVRKKRRNNGSDWSRDVNLETVVEKEKNRNSTSKKYIKFEKNKNSSNPHPLLQFSQFSWFLFPWSSSDRKKSI